jgi:hypothetical protein
MLGRGLGRWGFMHPTFERGCEIKTDIDYRVGKSHVSTSDASISPMRVIIPLETCPVRYGNY